MGKQKVLVLAVLALAVLAGGLRFYRLGTWPFAGDELATTAEADLLFESDAEPADSQAQRLPRLLPLAYLVHWADYRLFGKDEFGSRVFPALLGAAGVVVTFVLLGGLFGWPTATAGALLLALWPTHLGFSQLNRFYVTAAFFASLAMLAVSAVQRRSAVLACLACLATFAAILCHTFLGLLLPGLLAGVAASALAERKAPPWRVVLVILAAHGAAAAFALFYLLPLGRGWNQSEPWGYTPAHSLLASVNQLGWPTFLLALVGVLALAGRRDAQGWYWLVWPVLWAVESALLPLFVVYHPGYVFPLSLGIIVPAAYAIGTIYERLRPQQPSAIGWLAAACGLSLPGLASHYVDGSRHDLRTPAVYLAEHRRTDDVVTTPAPGLIGHYAPLLTRVVPLPLSGEAAFLRSLCKGPNRVWIVIPSGRSGKPDDLRQWLGTHCSQRLLVRKKRFDYYEYTVEVFLYEPPSSR